MKNILTKLTKYENTFLSKYKISDTYHRKTKLKKITYDPNVIPQEWITMFFKGYPRLKMYDLSTEFSNKIRQPFNEVLKLRHSTREFNPKKKITAKDISTLLYYSAGIKEVPHGDWDASRRFYPSAGARYPLELYIVVFGNSEIPKGIYHYYVKEHCLELLESGDFRHDVTKNVSNLDWVKDASVAIFISAVFPRNQAKYGDRGYRHILTENGCLTQNIYLASNALGLGCCSLGGFIDDNANKLLGIDGSVESVIGVIMLGHPKT